MNADTQPNTRSDWTVRGHLPLREFIVQAHRGAGDLAEENTLEAFPYGGSTPGTYAKLLDLGLMSFATDHPEVTWEAVKRYYEGP